MTTSSSVSEDLLKQCRILLQLLSLTFTLSLKFNYFYYTLCKFVSQSRIHYCSLDLGLVVAKKRQKLYTPYGKQKKKKTVKVSYEECVTFVPCSGNRIPSVFAPEEHAVVPYPKTSKAFKFPCK